MFWKRTSKWTGLEQDRVDKIIIGYNMAVDDIDAMLAHLSSLDPADRQLKELNEYKSIILRLREETVVGLTGISPIAAQIEEISDALGVIDDEIHALGEDGAAGAAFAWGVLATEAKRERGESLE